MLAIAQLLSFFELWQEYSVYKNQGNRMRQKFFPLENNANFNLLQTEKETWNLCKKYIFSIFRWILLVILSLYIVEMKICDFFTLDRRFTRSPSLRRTRLLAITHFAHALPHSWSSVEYIFIPSWISFIVVVGTYSKSRPVSEIKIKITVSLEKRNVETSRQNS